MIVLRYIVEKILVSDGHRFGVDTVSEIRGGKTTDTETKERSFLPRI